MKNNDQNNNQNDTQKILWLDLEMTGLIPEEDVIIEAAAVVTDENLKEIDSYESVVKQSDQRLQKMDQWNQKCHRKSGLYPLIAKGKDLAVVEADLLHFIEAHFAVDEKVVLAGNSIYQDRNFIRRHMPNLEKRLYYRMLDITSWKIVLEKKGIVFHKKNRHRALEDTRESIAEFAFFLKHIDIKEVIPQS